MSNGLAVLLISSDLPELIGMADRILVFCEGEMTAELGRGASQEAVMEYAFPNRKEPQSV